MSYDYGGYRIYNNNNPEIKYYFDKSTKGLNTAQYTHNQNRQELITFGRVPYIYYAGETDFQAIKLDTVFVNNICQDGECTSKSAREQFNEFKTLILKRVPLVLDNSQGEIFLVDVVIDNENTPQNHVTNESLDYIEVSVTCTEIGDVEVGEED